MNIKRLAQALNTVAVGFAEAAEALNDEVLPPLPAPSLADESVDWGERERILGECPVHQKPWAVKEGGISRNGKPYSAFWKCNGKNPDGSFCDKKPDKGWAASHDPEKALLEVPF